MVATAAIRDGTPVILRPVAPSDKGLFVRAFERLSDESRYRRFLAPTKELSRRMLRYLTELDHHEHEALLALDPETGGAVGMARFVRHSDRPGVAEVAVAVVDDWQGRGLGTLLLEVLGGRADDEGITRFTARALATNAEVFELLERLGDVRGVDCDAGAMETEIELGRGELPPALRELLRLLRAERGRGAGETAAIGCPFAGTSGHVRVAPTRPRPTEPRPGRRPSIPPRRPRSNLRSRR